MRLTCNEDARSEALPKEKSGDILSGKRWMEGLQFLSCGPQSGRVSLGNSDLMLPTSACLLMPGDQVDMADEGHCLYSKTQVLEKDRKNISGHTESVCCDIL